jgi:hypothetical protein
VAKALSTAWTKHLKDPEKKKALEGAIRNSVAAMTRLRDVLQEDDAALSNQQVSQPDNDASWAFRQAHLSGERLRIRKVLDLLSFLGD